MENYRQYINSLTNKDLMILVLGILLLIAILYIAKLHRKIKEEKRKRLLPLLDLEIDEKEPGAYLKNNSYCYAKDVSIDDADLHLKLGYDKHLTLKFDPIAGIKPSQRENLTYRVIDGDHDITSGNSPNLVNHFKGSEIELHLNYSNIEDMPFKAVIGIENNNFTIKSAAKLEA